MAEALPRCGGTPISRRWTWRLKVLAADKDPSSVKAGDLAQGEAVTIGADDDAAEILRTMGAHQVRRLPVIDGHTLVGIVALADVARALPDTKVGDLLEAISQT
ncbi:CBS domain-containing protein (plasmid) [Streptomyces yangpuensis]|uniref:CBS domain-containing protein n=1 Tax=Streptomyces yangpuensis TaxID=1648182 RepID=A0ABY5Q8H9_9ACTN|nr:CBS domain-containing protein [Streptomyces yangpuensis]UUY52524.1 CBS domain-containing protein [Streptomyces yangpuensis]